VFKKREEKILDENFQKYVDYINKEDISEKEKLKKIYDLNLRYEKKLDDL